MIRPLLINLLAMILLSCTRSLWGSVLTKWVFADLSLIVARIVVLVLLYCLAALLVKFAVASLNLLTKLPVLHFLDKLLGTCTGFVSGMLCIWVFLALVYIMRETAFGIWALPQIEENTTMFFLYEHNLITYIVAEFV